MKLRTSGLSALLVAALAAGCSPATRHKVLTTLFDGVPPEKTEAPVAAPSAAARPAGPASRRSSYSEHGPYAAKLCNACHSAGATNNLVAPKDALCLQCHVLRTDVRYVHGPVVSGGCLVCHDPHSSKYGYLLVSDTDGFCLRCHDADDVRKIQGHAEVQANCTDCHDAHGSNQRYLLK